MSTLQKTLTEKLILIDRQKNQLKEAQVEIERVKQRKPVEQSPTRALNEELEKVVEEKESLMSYIDEQRATLKRKISYISELEEEINRLGDKESHYTDIERPKLIQQLG
jgi:septal ring factor EnvC (AmiA/AmiB activator)